MVQTPLSTGWDFCRRGTQEWRQARVPGHVHDDLVRHGVVADPFYRMNEKECQWVDQEDWVYRCRFDWSAKDGGPKRVLRFEGLDTVCSVFLNGSLVAEHDNMFLPLEVDVTSLLRASNELVVEFSSAVRVANERRSAYLAKERIAPSLSTFYERSFVRKAQYMFGWDWGPRLVSCGVWKPVWLLEYDTRVTDVWVRPRLEDGEWLVDVSWEGEKVSKPEVRTMWHAPETVTTIEHSDRSLILRVNGAELWQPNGLRPSEVYKLNLAFGPFEKEVSFGLRTVELVREPDKWGESFEFVVNGERVFCKGANWIPDHSFPSLVSRRDYEEQVHSMTRLHFNMVRAWGGGMYESDDFYNRCDQYGIMVWQDFPFACAYYPEDEPFLAGVEAEARANIRRLRNHPSLVLWCGNNENQQMHEQKWGGDESPERFYGEKIYDDLLPRILKEEDPDRPYVHGSPSGKVEGRDSNMDGVGDSHYWDVWHGRGDWKHYEESTSRFSSEFGFASSPSLCTWSKTVDRKTDWAFDSEAVKWHDKTLKGYEKYISFIELHYPKVETLEDLVYFSQLNQRDALRCGIEHYLMSEFCAGTLVWQFNDCWPAQGWAVQDSERNMKPSGHELARLYAVWCSTTRVTKDLLEVFFRSNLPEGWDRTPLLTFSILDLSGETLLSHEQEISLPFGEFRTKLAEFDLSLVDRARAVFMSEIGTFDRLIRPRSARLLCEPKEFTQEAGRLVVSTASQVVRQLSSDQVLVDLVLYDPDFRASGYYQFCPVYVPGAPFVLNLDYEPKRLVARSLAGFHEVEIARGPL